MAHIVPEKLEFCGGCGNLLPIPEERQLTNPNDPDSSTMCPNCGTSTHKHLPVIGYFDPSEAARLRCL